MLSSKIACMCSFSINAGSVRASLYKQIIFPNETGMFLLLFKDTIILIFKIYPAVHCSTGHGLKFKKKYSK